MKTFLAFLLLFSLSIGLPEVQAFGIRKVFGNWFNGGVLPACTGCPFRNCLKDNAVILGYCCGCARVTDYLPIDCSSLRLNCPVDGSVLCHDYDYMLNCCC